MTIAGEVSCPHPQVIGRAESKSRKGGCLCVERCFELEGGERLVVDARWQGIRIIRIGWLRVAVNTLAWARRRQTPPLPPNLRLVKVDLGIRIDCRAKRRNSL